MRRYLADAAVAAPDFCITSPLHGASREQGFNVAVRFDHAIFDNSAILVDAVHLVSCHLALSPRPEVRTRGIELGAQPLQLPLEEDVWRIGSGRCALQDFQQPTAVAACSKVLSCASPIVDAYCPGAAVDADLFIRLPACSSNVSWRIPGRSVTGSRQRESAMGKLH